MYGFKQSPHAWFRRVTTVLWKFDYCPSNTDHTLFFKHTPSGVTILLGYVNDITIIGSDAIEEDYLNKYLAKEFDIKTLGLKYFLGIEVAHSFEGIFISQQKYVVNLLKDIGKFACKPPNTPLDSNHKFYLGEGEEVIDQEIY